MRPPHSTSSPLSSLLSLDARVAIAISYDLVVVAMAWTISFLSGYGISAPPEAYAALWSTLPVVLAVHLVCFAGFRLYRGIWRYASVPDFRQIALAVGVAGLLAVTALFLWTRAELTPRSALVLNPLLVLLFMTGGRISYRWWKEHRPYERTRHVGTPVLILGAGDEGYKLVTQLLRSESWAVVGLLDDNRSKIGRTVYGAPVLGSWDRISAVAVSTGAHHAILAVTGDDHRVRRRAFELCERAGLQLMVLPDIDELISGQARVSTIREFRIEDLLRRDPVRLDATGLRQMIAGTTVMVTGAGGSIGSELCRQIARFAPQRLVLFDSSEYALYRVTEELTRLHPGIELVPCIGDVKDAARLQDILAAHPPETVFHAAAYKHVPLMERHNAWQAIRNNTLGTVTLVQAIARHPVRRMIFVSTDKAINPTSVMGASKRLAELLLLRWSSRVSTQIIAVRFGNVLGSTGSVVPKFKEQIAMGGPITVTDPEMRRYFMLVPEAAQLVLQAALVGNGGEVFVLDMGEPVRIADLARDLIRLSGLTEEQIPIRYTGLRPGEKLYEELLADSESTLPTRHPKIRISSAHAAPDEAWEARVMAWMQDASPRSDRQVRDGLARFVPEYQPYAPADEDEEAEAPAPTASNLIRLPTKSRAS